MIVATPPTALNVVDRSNTGITGSNPTRSMDVRISLLVLSCIDSDLVMGRSPGQGVLPNVQKIRTFRN
jgi:hypothetical protein